MPAKVSEGGAVVCPLCLLTEEFCSALKHVESLRFAEKMEEGVTKTRALSLCHINICACCRKPKDRCQVGQRKGKQCAPRELAKGDSYPAWFRFTELMDQDQHLIIPEKRKVHEPIPSARRGKRST